MSDDGRKVTEGRRALHAAVDDLRRFEGKAPLPDPANDPSVPAEPPFCSFCGTGRNHVAQMIEGPGVFICDACVEACHDVLRDKRR